MNDFVEYRKKYHFQSSNSLHLVMYRDNNFVALIAWAKVKLTTTICALVLDHHALQLTTGYKK